MSEEILNLLEEARLHAERLVQDIPLSKTREEHVRVTARANEAVHIESSLLKFFSGEGGE